MIIMPEYKITLDRKVLKLLGSQLYGDTPSVIAELVANSYDADANNVWITLNTENNSIVIEDDGKGMTSEEINSSFLNIGYNKRVDERTTNLGRKVMGRKGIGKLAVFSLTDKINVFSSKDGEICGCSLDFNKITLEEDEPREISEESIILDKDKLSIKNTGTRIELCGVKKKISLGFRFIVSKLIRMFDVNDNTFKVLIRKNNEQYKELHRSELNYFSIMDTIITIGNQHEDKRLLVLKNEIDTNYKITKNYEDYINEQPKNKNMLSKFPYKINVESINGNIKHVDFTFHGWIGTVKALGDLNDVEKRIIGEDAEDEEKVTIYDNRISLYSRGKLGEYDILPKIKSNTNNEAYVIGELFVDIFEDDELVDMAISNRRGYEESDNRYIEVIKIAKKLLGYVVKQKKLVSKLIQDDVKRKKDQEESKEIIEQFLQDPKAKKIFDEKLNYEERLVIQDANLQFSRAINLKNETKKIFISHKAEHKLYGQFIVSVLEEYGINVVSSVIFSSDPRLGVPYGKDIYDYLKECFREDLMVIFLFSKSFYDSNICIAEVGAAWATNKNYINVVIDIGFSDIDKPANNALNSIKFNNFKDEDQKVTLYKFFETVIKNGLNLVEVDEEKLKSAINSVLSIDKYKSSNIDNPEIFCPTRKFTLQIICSKCNNKMSLIKDGSKVWYKCSNVSCSNMIETTI